MAFNSINIEKTRHIGCTACTGNVNTSSEGVKSNSGCKNKQIEVHTSLDPSRPESIVTNGFE